ncbi:hypothetical protein [Chryseobacterium viscerum]|uniref:Uncharacterized protein n=1 Tax=Chryseobacterium viscerum TaxID=1037377 RepID=A0A5N4BKI8_9FLAO|nr:hypothetical protein [Chryseobacterium viscerum]KAB1228625.1 hypothetical protein F8D52_21410 [Chryseobacterium viscerum]
MKDIFEFKIVIHENLSENLVNCFIAFIEDRSMYWGGGYGDNQINGGLYTDESVIININDFVKEFIAFFLHLEITIHKIEINMEDFYFYRFDHDAFVENYSSLRINIGCWEF